MRNLYLCVSLLCTILFASRQYATANELYPISLTERTNNATVIAEGKVISQHSFLDTRSNNIYTSNKIEVYRLFKGTISTTEIEIITHGGRVGNRIQVYSSYLKLRTGQSGIFFCIPSTVASNTNARQAASYMVYSSMQGFIGYDANQVSASDPFTKYDNIAVATTAVKQITRMEKVIQQSPVLKAQKNNNVLRVLATPVITGISPSIITAGTGDILTITGTDFGPVRATGTVLFRNADNGGSTFVSPLTTDFVSWTDTEIKVRVPSLSQDIFGSSAGSGPVRVVNSTPDTSAPSASLTIPYSYINLQDGDGNIFLPVHYAQNGARGGYTLHPQINFAANVPARDAFTRGMQSWICNTQMNWNLGDTTSVDITSFDYINVIRFDHGTELSPGVLGLCTTNYNLCGSDGTAILDDIDITFDDANAGNYIWQFGPTAPNSSEVDFESVALHELGHAMQLNHVILPGAVMHYALSKGQLSRTLSANDINGGSYITNQDFANICGAPVMTPGGLFLGSGIKKAICSESPFIYTPYAGNAVTYTWTRPAVGGISTAAGSGSNGVNEILVNSTASPVVANYNYSLTNGTCTGSEVVAVTVKPINVALAGTAGGAQSCASYTVQGIGTSYSDATCNLIAEVIPSGASPVTGTINVCSRYESSVPSYKGQAYCARHYDIEPASNASTATGTITLYYTQAEFNDYNAANLGSYHLPNTPADAAGIANVRITQFHGTSATGAPGSYSGGTMLIDPADANVIWNATAARWEITFDVTGFSGFFVHTGFNALPLHLLQFSGTISGNSNQLQWTTAAEQSTDHFDIQRSADGISYTTVAQVTASGSTVQNVTYKYNDDVTKNLQPQYYYRLKMVDKDAQFTYSPTVLLKRNNLSFLVKALQNPFHQQLQVNITSPKKQTGVITLTDMNGSRLSQQTVSLPEGTTVIDVPGANKLGAGTYVLTLVTDSEKKVIKVLKQQ